MSAAATPSSGMNSPAGIPRVIFDEDPERLLLPGKSAEDSILGYRDLTQKFRFLESNLEERFQRTEVKRSELAKNLQVVRMLQRQPPGHPVDLHFELGEGVWARGRAAGGSECRVHLWLSTTTMVVYTPSEAESMLVERLEETKTQLQKIDEEQRYLKEQLTTAEVNMARLYNYHLALAKK